MMQASDRDPSEADLDDNGVGVDAARHVKQILEAAEEAAAAVRAEAEEEARHYLAEYRRRVDELDAERARISSSLVEQADKMRDQYNRFLETLDGAVNRAADSGADRGLLDRLRGVRGGDKDPEPEAESALEPETAGAGTEPEPEEPARGPRRFDPRSGRREKGGDEAETLPGGYRPRSRGERD